MESRINNVIEFLKEGFPFKVDELYFGIDESDSLNVTGASQHTHLENITKQTALKELREIKSLFEDMVSSSNELRKFIVDKQIKFNLDFDYGMGDIRICSEQNGIVYWKTKIRE